MNFSCYYSLSAINYSQLFENIIPFSNKREKNEDEEQTFLLKSSNAFWEMFDKLIVHINFASQKVVYWVMNIVY